MNYKDYVTISIVFAPGSSISLLWITPFYIYDKWLLDVVTNTGS